MSIDVEKEIKAMDNTLREAVGTPGVHVHGDITVDLIDPDTDRVIDRQEGSNYVNTTQLNEWAKSVQKLAWTFGYQGDPTTTVTANPYTGRDPRLMPTVRNDQIACWTDNTAETTADMFCFGEITAWAHRYQQGSPSTRQGIVVPTLCTLSNGAVKWVWEWGTPNGNGTFQSVGWRRLNVSTATGEAILADVAHYARRWTSLAGFTGDPSGAVQNYSTPTVGANIQMEPLYYDSVSGKMYFITNVASAGKLCSTPVTIDGNGNYTLGAVTDESAAAFAAGVGGNNVSTSTLITQGLTRMGSSGDWIAVGWTSSGGSKRPFIKRVNTAGTVAYTNANAATYAIESGFIDVTYDGTNIWCTAFNGTNGSGAVHRIDPATGTISATISAPVGIPAYFPLWITQQTPHGIEWDPTNNWFWLSMANNYYMNIDSSGNWMGSLVCSNGTQFPPGGVGTLSGQHNAQRANPRAAYETDDFTCLWGEAGTGAPTNSQLNPFSQSSMQLWTSGDSSAPMAGAVKGRLTTMDGDIWNQCSSGASYQSGSPVGSQKVALMAFTDRPNFATRSLLTGSVSKTNTVSMRITYTMSFS